MSVETNVEANVGGTVERKLRPWPWVLGAVGGAVIVGAAWGITAYANEGGPLIAKVGDTAIHQSDLYAKLEATGGSSELEEMIDEQLIADGAKKYHLTASSSEINSALSSLEASEGISGTSELDMFLAENNMTMSQLNSLLKMQVLEQKLAERNVKVTNAEIQSYYNKNKSQFTKSGQKTPQPLSKVKSQVIAAIKASKAESSTQVLADLAKQNPITIYDDKYSSVKDDIVNSTSSGS
ncbi:peptidyl-prolyl cis-trans isomerase [Alicyclobacillus cycloheptanicus]|jgi:foldase protein PrsA|uniref:PpiC domain-containing protein n=1 Tax=Alicyclobacillus cycloheptanicus TaxID=1457 RepID=A0ABT9XEL6_9BACL|nr:peptidylprolyl isomerase [Alicyclobacillus cycloheptanicus]MDQ0188627.1 hypothetical protein [Alicyclobacillus cycloheptanicus]WDM00697.1 peptidyl-prolyl cis-trans isomerase [Alicyclobacillus cycloheptanicus]